MSAPASNRTLGELADEYGRTDELDDLPAVPGVEEYDPEASVALDADDTEIEAMADEHGRTDRLTEPHEPAESVVENIAAESSNGDNLELQACPCCPREFADERDVRQHLEAVDPEHFGLVGPGGDGQ